MTVAPKNGSLGGVGNRIAGGVDIDIVIAASMHLDEWYLAHWCFIYSFTSLAVCLPLAIALTTSEAPFLASPQTKTFSGY